MLVVVRGMVKFIDGLKVAVANVVEYFTGKSCQHIVISYYHIRPRAWCFNLALY